MRKGNINTNSTSKIKKIIAIRKNRIVKGSRALNLGLNPHSKGLIFSNLKRYFFLKTFPNSKTIDANIAAIKKNIKK